MKLSLEAHWDSAKIHNPKNSNKKLQLGTHLNQENFGGIALLVYYTSKALQAYRGKVVTFAFFPLPPCVCGAHALTTNTQFCPPHSYE